MMQGKRVLDQAVKHSIEETWAVFTPETGNPMLPSSLPA